MGNLTSAQLNVIFGTPDIFMFWVCVAFSWIGAWIRIMYNVMHRDPNAVGSPVKMSWDYFWEHNFVRIIFNLLTLLIIVRFSNEIIGSQLNPFAGLGAGLFFDMYVGKVFIKKGATDGQQAIEPASFTAPTKQDK